MKFTQIKVPKEITQLKGIEEINIQRLSDVVVFVGKNGSGKTRILDLIEGNLFSIANITPQNIDSGLISCLPKQLEQIKPFCKNSSEVKILQEHIKYLKPQRTRSPALFQDYKEATEHLDQITNSLDQANIQLQSIVPELQFKYLKRIHSAEIQQLQQAIAGTNQSPNTRKITFETLLENVAENITYNELNLINQNALNFLAKLPHQLATDKLECNMKEKEFEKRKSYKIYLSLQKFISDLLKKDLTWESQISNSNMTDKGNEVTLSGIWKLNGREFNYPEFSDGEKLLFAYALLFFLLDQNPNLNIRESIILIDEPELHLHPDSEIDLIEGIRNVIKDKGQLIIATHSINILSALNYDEIFMVKDGAITPPGQATPTKSLSELMGIEQRINKLTDFLSSISTWTYVNFITQCFTDPETIATANPKDPQIEAFKKVIKERSNKNSNILLDFGAGKGRLYQQIKSDNDFINSVNYHALEPENDCHLALKDLGASNIYTKHTDLPPDKFDFILLCNVLHEIPLEEWETTLNAVINSLKSDGYLIIIEVKVLNKGEKIGKTGYLVLDKEEIQKLFGLSSLPSTIVVEGKEDVITCVVINKSELSTMTRSNIRNALEALEKNTLKKIEEIREKEYTSQELYGIGRKVAFLSQQHINAKIAQKSLR